MKVLVLTLNAWNDANSTGNTISNLFSALSPNDEVANIYCRNEPINNSICKLYFKLTENDILRNIFSPKTCGQIVTDYDNNNQSVGFNILAKNNVGDFLRRHRFAILRFLRECIWNIPVWKNANLDKFLLEFAPDVIYMHEYSNIYMHRILDYCAKKTGAKIVTFWGDDLYSRKCKDPLGYLYETLLRKCYRKSIRQASFLAGASLMLCDEYSEIFFKKFIPFFKECRQVHYDDSKKISNPLTIIYAGNLLFGREQVIVNLVKAISRVNAKKLSRQLFLKVFSNTNPSEESMAILDDKKNSCFMGCKSYRDVCEEMDRAELVLFIESFDKRNIQLTRLSFSTKIIDCMQSTACILAIGPKKIASIDYLSRNNLGYIITEMSEIDSRLEYLAEHPEIIQKNNLHKVDYAKKYHTNTSVKALNEIRDIL